MSRACVERCTQWRRGALARADGSSATELRRVALALYHETALYAHLCPPLSHHVTHTLAFTLLLSSFHPPIFSPWRLVFHVISTLISSSPSINAMNCCINTLARDWPTLILATSISRLSPFLLASS